MSVSGAKLEPKFSHYSTQHGLSHNGVLCITEDSEGFIWLGTWDGINRFDGNNFKTYKARPGDNSSLKNNKIRDIVEDKLGYLWVKTYDKKVYRFDKAKELFLPLKKSNKGENLENVFVNKIIPVSNGDVWLFTENKGILCVSNTKNGDIDITYYNAENSPFRSDKVNFIFEDSKNRVWFGTKRGIFCMVKVNGRYMPYLASKTKEFENLNFNHISGSEYGHVYFTTVSGELVEFNAELESFKSKKIGTQPIIDIEVSKTGRVYLTATKHGLIVYDPKSSHIEYQKQGLTFLSIYEDKSGNIWLEPEVDGAAMFVPSKNTFHFFIHNKDYDLPYIVKDSKSFNVFEDTNNMVWVTLKGGGFGYFEKEGETLNYFYNNPVDKDRLFSNNVVSVYSDRKGVLWFSTRNGGINKVVFSPNNFQYKQLVKNSINKYDNEVRALFQDSDGKIWITSKIGKLYVYKNDEIVNVIEPTQKIGSIYSIAEDRNKNIWIGTKGDGLVKLTPENDKRVRYKVSRYRNNPTDLTSLSNDQIYAITEDKAGRLWIGTFGGSLNLLVEENGVVKFKNVTNSFKNYPRQVFNVIRAIIQDPYDNIWLATTDGILRFNPNGNPDNIKFVQTTKIPGDKNSLGNNDVHYLYSSDKIGIWVGTFGGGLNKVTSNSRDINNPLKFKTYTTEHGLPNDIILGVVEDKNSNLWIATENGVSKLDIKSETFRNYDTYDGLPRTGFSESACFKSSKGEIFFGGVNGYVSFDPEKIVNERFPANLALTGLQLFNKDIDIKDPDSPLQESINYVDKITLNHNQDVLTFEYAVLDYRAPKNVSYAYILEGYEDNWNYVKNQTKATYTKIPPGKYTFRVKTVDNYYFENSPEKSIQVTIQDPWWLSGWAILSYVLLGVLALILVRKLELKMIGLKNKVTVEEKMTELKVQFFTNISHELRTPLTLIVNPLLKVIDSENLSHKGIKHLQVANKNADRMLRFVNQLLDFRKIQTQNLKLKIERVELVSFMTSLLEHFAGIIEEKNITLKLNTSSEEIFVWCDRDKMDIVFFNIISNALKFTPKNKSVFIRLEKKDREILIQVIDEGIGIGEDNVDDLFKLYYEGDNQQDKAFKGTGIGLALSKDIVNLHNGTITGFKNQNEGMTFSIHLLEGNLHFDPTELLDENKWGNKQEKVNYTPKTGYQDISHVVKNKKGLPKILIVEDNSELRSFTADLLRDSYTILEAENGSEGYLKAIELLPDVILSDVMMPEMDGIQMLEKLKDNLNTSHIPIILLTSKAAIEDQLTGLSYGADFYVTKPFHPEYVKQLLKNLLNSREKLVSTILEKPAVLKLEPSEIVITSKDEAFLRNLIQIIEEKLSDAEFNIDSVATSMSMGRTTFYKKLKSLTNATPVEFVRDIRLKRGKQLLDTGEMTVSEIAYQIGFNTLGYFSTCFKEKYNISPSDYLKSRTEN